MVLPQAGKCSPAECQLGGRTNTGSPDGSADGDHGLLLANDPVVQGLLHLDQLLTLITAHLLNGNTCSGKAHSVNHFQHYQTANRIAE